MAKIQRLESMLLSDGGGTVGEAIRLCTRRIDQQQATLDDVRSRVRAQEANMEWSEGETLRIFLVVIIELRTEEGEEARQLRGFSKVQCLGHHHHRRSLIQQE